MSIRVEDIYKKFPFFRTEDMNKLMNGRKNYGGKDIVPLTNIASYQGKFSKDLSLFTAKEEGANFIEKCPQEKQVRIFNKIGADKFNNDFDTMLFDKNESIFDISKNRKGI